MAGGEGTRLRPLTSNQPKPMVPIVGKPCMEHILELLKQHGMEDVIVTLAFLPQAIRGYFGDGEALGLSIEYSVEDEPLGTAGSVRLASDRLDDTFLVISGDALCDVDLTKLVEFHREQGAAVTIGLKAVDNPLEFGIVVTDEEGRIERFLEKPTLGPGLLGHDQHRHLRRRARGAAAHPRRPALRLVEGALPAAARDGPAALRLHDGRLLAGHREPRPVPAGELRRARREREAERPRDPAARQRLDRRGRRARRARGRGGARVRRQLLPHLAGRDGRAVLGARELASRCASAPAPSAAIVDASTLHRPQRADRGRDRRPLVRHPLARPRPRGRRDRRRGHARRAVGRDAERADLPVQGGRVRRADPREPDLGVARQLAPVRRGRRLRARQRRPDPRDGGPARRRARHGDQARRPRRREPRVATAPAA